MGKGKGKRNSSIVILSSDDDEDKDFVSSKTNSRYTKSAPSRRNPKKRAKTVSLSNSCSRALHHSDSTGFDEVRRLCDEFGEGFTKFKVSSGLKSKDLWVDKYKPGCLEDLAVQKKKVEEVKMWFEERLRSSVDSSHAYLILISGQAGVGKSATIYAIASHLGAEVCEWNTPTPTIWQEHLHTSSSGIRYMSKLEEFESFVERIRKYGLVSSRDAPSSIIYLIDDLPMINGKVSYERLHRCFHLLLQSVRMPTAILMNDYGKSDSAENHARYWEELQSSLQKAGALKVAFNPITVNSIKKVLSRLCRLELFEVSDEHIDLIAKASGGDIRHAITSLQYFSLKPCTSHSVSVPKSLTTDPEEKVDESSLYGDEVFLPFGKDATLSLFHALGKFLHNKRENENLIASDNIPLKQKFVRFPLKMDAPEVVLAQAHGQTRLVADFLYENVLDFVREDAIEEASVVAEYLSDTDFLLAPLTGNLSRNIEAENVIQSAAASVAARGVLFGNTCPLSSRWHAIGRPKLWQVEQSSLHNKYQIKSQGRDVHSCTSLNRFSVIATEFKPALNWLGHRASVISEVEDDTYGMDENDKVIESDDDDIEDW